MTVVLEFLERFEIVIYVVLGIAGVFSFIRLLQAWREWRNTLFGLERENSQRRLRNLLAVVVLLSLVAVTEFVLITFVAPAAPLTAQFMATPTLDLLAEPTPTLPAEPAVASEPTAVENLTTMLVPNSSEGCVQGKIEWTFPLDGEEISGEVILKATIQVENLSFYKYEYSQLNANAWETLAAGNTLITDGEMGQWNTDLMSPGDYQLRLVVIVPVDGVDQALPACQIAVRIVGE